MSTAGWADTIQVGIETDDSKFHPEQAVAKAMREVARVAEKAADSVERSFKQAAGDSETALRKVGGPNTFSGIGRAAEREAHRVDKAFKTTSGTGVALFAGLGASIGSAATGGIASLAHLATGAVRAGLRTASAMQMSRIAFTQLLGSAKEADKFMRQLADFAAHTPFELPGLVDATRGLIGAGLSAKESMTALAALGNASAALGLNQEAFGRVMLATTQIMNKGKVSAEELMQMNEAGLPVQKLLAKSLGITTGELLKQGEAGKLQSDVVLPKLFEQMQKDYGGSMEKQAHTLDGAWSTFKDNLNITMSETLAPLVDWLSVKLPQAGETLKGALEAIRKFIHDDLAPEVGLLTDAWDRNKEAFATLAGTLDENSDSLDKSKDAAHGLVQGLADVIDFAGQVAKALHGADTFMHALTEQVNFFGSQIHFMLVVPAVKAFGAFLDYVLGVYHDILRASATMAEALHLPWAKGLRKAEQELEGFTTSVKREFDAIPDEEVNVDVAGKFGWQGLTPHRVGNAWALAAGGPVRGAGTGTSDSVPLWGSAGEHMWTAAEVRAAGGHQAVEQLRRNALHRAGGGPIPRLNLPSVESIVGPVAARVSQLSSAIDAMQIGLRMAPGAAATGPGYGGGNVIGALTAWMAGGPWPFNVISGFRPGAVTRGTGRTSLHALGRAIDMTGPNKMGLWARAVGWPHKKEVIYSPAPYQVYGSGVHPGPPSNPITRADHYSHVHFGAFDRGGWLWPGTTIAQNRSGAPERVLGPGEGTGGVVVHQQVVISPSEAQVPALAAVMAQVARAEARTVVEEYARQGRRGGRA